MGTFWGLFTFSGRISRRTLWINYTLTIVAIAVAAALVDQAVLGRPVLTFIAGLITAALSLMAHVRRCHDRDRSGWWLLLSLTGIGAIWLFIELGFLRGTAGPNRFGPDPVGGAGRSPFPVAA